MLIWRERPDYVGNDTPASGTSSDRFPLWGALRLIRESPYLRAIAALILICGVDHDDRRLAVQGDRQGGGARHRRAGDVLRHLQHDRRA